MDGVIREALAGIEGTTIASGSLDSITINPNEDTCPPLVIIRIESECQFTYHSQNHHL
jgi:hypothetical protein